MNSENNTNDTNISQYAAVKEVLKICFLHRSEAGWTWSAPVLSVALAMLSELLSFLVMKIISDFYLSITSFDEHLFASTAERAIIVVISISLVKCKPRAHAPLCSKQQRQGCTDEGLV